MASSSSPRRASRSKKFFIWNWILLVLITKIVCNTSVNKTWQIDLVVHLWALLGRAEEDGPEGLPVLAAHEVVEDRVQGGGEEVEAARHVHQVLVECPIPKSLS